MITDPADNHSEVSAVLVDDHDLFRGGLKEIRILKRGDSPRIDTALLIGTRGRTRIRGDTLQFALDAYDRWMTFRVRR